jgi:hypothetical protein
MLRRSRASEAMGLDLELVARSSTDEINARLEEQTGADLSRGAGKGLTALTGGCQCAGLAN